MTMPNHPDDKESPDKQTVELEDNVEVKVVKAEDKEDSPQQKQGEDD